LGRLLKRVPMDFDWPQNTTWEGYLNQYWSSEYNCPACDGEGWSLECKALRDRWHGFDRTRWVYIEKGYRYNDEAWCYHLDEDDIQALVDDGRLFDFTRRPRTDEQWEMLREQEKSGESSYWLKETNGYIPTPQEVNDWAKIGIGHDSINCHTVIKAKLAREGKSDLCPECGGDGSQFPTPEHKERYENWEAEEPPTGEGYQLWEDTTEGSPCSPVFATLDELCAWCAVHSTTFGSFKATKEEWRKMLDDGFVAYKDDNGNIFL